MLQAAKVAKEAEALRAAGRRSSSKGRAARRSYAWRGSKAACGGVASIVAAAKAMAPASEPAPEAARLRACGRGRWGWRCASWAPNGTSCAMRSSRSGRTRTKQQLRQKLAAAEQRQAAIVVAFTQSAALKQAAFSIARSRRS